MCIIVLNNIALTIGSRRIASEPNEQCLTVNPEKSEIQESTATLQCWLSREGAEWGATLHRGRRRKVEPAALWSIGDRDPDNGASSLASVAMFPKTFRHALGDKCSFIRSRKIGGSGAASHLDVC